jgi:hypothetical protein
MSYFIATLARNNCKIYRQTPAAKTGAPCGQHSWLQYRPERIRKCKDTTFQGTIPEEKVLGKHYTTLTKPQALNYNFDFYKQKLKDFCAKQ